MAPPAVAAPAALWSGSGVGTHTPAITAGDDLGPLDCGSIPSTADPAVIRIVYQVGSGLGVSDRVMLAGFEAGWVESHMNNLNCGDRDSLGVFQQRPSQGWGSPEQIMNVAFASNSFFTRAINVAAANPGWSAGRVAQAVQVSAFPDRYDAAEPIARDLMARARPSGDRVSDFNGDGYADVLGVDSLGKLWYYPNQRLSLSTAHQIGQNWSTFRHAMAADWSGDGAADVLGVDSSGKLWYYPNQRLSLPTGYQIGHGWSTFRQVMAADWSGDGAADVLGVDSSGNLWYYPHQGSGLATPAKIGYGWSTFRHVMAADWSGDGAADVLGVDSSGNLWYYPHQGSGLGTAVKIGHGWSTFKFVHASDFSGDGAADILGVDSSGNLWYYPHHGAGLTTPVKIGHGWSTFKFVI